MTNKTTRHRINLDEIKFKHQIKHGCQVHILVCLWTKSQNNRDAKSSEILCQIDRGKKKSEDRFKIQIQKEGNIHVI